MTSAPVHDTALASGARAVEFYGQAYRRFRSTSNASNPGEALQIVAQVHLPQEGTASAIAAFQEVRRTSAQHHGGDADRLRPDAYTWAGLTALTNCDLD